MKKISVFFLKNRAKHVFQLRTQIALKTKGSGASARQKRFIELPHLYIQRENHSAVMMVGQASRIITYEIEEF